MLTSTDLPGAPGGARAAFIAACQRGDPSATRLLKGFPVERGSWPAAISGLQATLQAGNVPLFCALLAASPLARIALHGPDARALLANVFAGAPMEALDAVVCSRPNPPTWSYLQALLETYGELAPERRDKVAPSGSGVLSLALWQGLDSAIYAGRTQDLILSEPPSQAPRLLAELASGPARHSGGMYRLANTMRIAMLLREKARTVRPEQPPSMDEVLSVVRAAAGGPWGASIPRWLGWLISFESMAGGVPWHALHRRAMPEPDRSVFWLALAERMAGDGSLKDVPPAERDSIMQALLKDVLAFAIDPRNDAVPGGPDGNLPSAVGSVSPLNKFLVSWRATAYPGLVEQAVAANDFAMVRRLVGFGASLDQVLPGGQTLLQHIAFNRNVFLATPGKSAYSKENCRANWGVVTAQGESIIHLIFKKDPRIDGLSPAQDLQNALALLVTFSSYLPPSVYSMRDASGKLPWDCLQVYLARLGNDVAVRSAFSIWAGDNPELAAALVGGHLQAALPPPPSRADRRLRL